MSNTVADALAAGLRRHGVTSIFGQSLPSLFFLSAARHGIRQISYRTENAGGAMADGYARVSHRLGVVAAQNGPAAALLVPPLAEAMKASSAVLALVQEVPTRTRDKNAFQEINHFDLFRGTVKWIRELNQPERVDDLLDMAVVAATSGRPGPAVLLLPKDVLAQEVPARRLERTARFGEVPLDRQRPEQDRIEEAARLLADARNPIVIAGGGVFISDAAEALAQLQDRAHLPVATTNMGKGSVSDDHPLSMGVVGNYMGSRSATRYLRDLISEADVVLLIGTRTNENGTDAWTLLPNSARVIHVDVDGEEIGRNYEALRLTGDAQLTLLELLSSLERHDLTYRADKRDHVCNRIATARERHRSEAAEVVQSQAQPIRPERVMAEVDALLGSEAVVVADASYSTIWVGNYLSAKAVGQRFLSPRGLAGLGWGLPLAIGARVARPDAKVVCVTGDGGFAHVWSEMETAIRSEVPVTIILLKNNILGFQKHAELVQFGEYTSAIPFGTVDHAAIARGCGAEAFSVTQPDDLAPVLRSALECGRATLIEVHVDPDAYPPITAWSDQTAVLQSEDLGTPGPLAAAR